MTTTSSLPAVTVDLVTGRLLLDGKPVELRPKTWDLLRFLVENPTRLVTKEEIFDGVWPDTAVGDAALSKTMSELRTALDDSRKPPAFIETVPRRGFRWIGPVSVFGGATSSAPSPMVESTPQAAIIGRSGELAALDAAFERSARGRRHVVFVTGEGGAGKTTLVERFLDGAASRGGKDSPLVARGQCLAFSGTHEPYLPVFEVLEDLVRRGGPAITALLERFAPSWLDQMPAMAPDPSTALRSQPGRMPREFLAFVHELARGRTVVLLLEDVHWADLATSDLCHMVARQGSDTRLLVVVTMRKADAIVAENPLVAVMADLVARGVATELPLESFAVGDVTEYLHSRCPGLEASAATGGGAGRSLADWLHFQSAGNPLFVRLVVDDWISRGLVQSGEAGSWELLASVEQLRAAVPDSLRALLERQLARLSSSERAVLEAASVRSAEFPAASIAACIGSGAEETDELCDAMARRGHFLRFHAGDGPRRSATRYEFLHAIVRHVVVASLTRPQHRRLHLATAAQLERENAGRLETVAHLLAAHYEEAGASTLALQHYLEAARKAVLRDSVADANATHRRCLAIVDEAEDIEDRDTKRLLVLQNLLQSSLYAYGFLDPGVREMVAELRRRSEVANAELALITARNSEIAAMFYSGRYREGEAQAHEMLTGICAGAEHPGHLFVVVLAGLLTHRLGRFEAASQFYEQAIAAKVGVGMEEVAFLDVKVLAFAWKAFVNIQTGDLEAAAGAVRESEERFAGKGNVEAYYANILLAEVECLLGDVPRYQSFARRAHELGEEQGIEVNRWHARFLLGRARAARGDIDGGEAEMRAALAENDASGEVCFETFFCMQLAEALLDAGREGSVPLIERAFAVAERTGERYLECELRLLRARALAAAGEDIERVSGEFRLAADLAAERGDTRLKARAEQGLADLPR